jgi:hypothetical protein
MKHTWKGREGSVRKRRVRKEGRVRKGGEVEDGCLRGHLRQRNIPM